MKAEHSRLIPRTLAENLELLIDFLWPKPAHIYVETTV